MQKRTRFYVDVPEEPTIEKFILRHRPLFIYINSAFDRSHNQKGLLYIAPPTETRKTTGLEGGSNT